MRRAARKDGNQDQIVDDLRKAGASVQSLSGLGEGVPDLLVGWRGRNFTFEIKDPIQKPSKRTLTDDEKIWHALWRGQVTVIEKTEDALKVMQE